LLSAIDNDSHYRLYSKVNIYFQDESRFGLKTNVARVLTAKGVKAIVKYQHAFKSTYLYGSFSPVDGSSFVWEVEGVSSLIFSEYLKHFSKYKPKELKIVIIDNAGFHSTKNFDIPDNIILINIPPYSPELNPAEKIWGYLKSRFKNKVFKTLDNVKKWLHKTVRDDLSEKRIKSITHDALYLNAFNAHFD
jgi:transposase